MERVRRVPFPSLKLGALLGKGATGEVFVGELQGAPVAVKRLALSSKDPDVLATLSRRFRAEVGVLSTYSHPRLVRLLAWAEDEGSGAAHPFAMYVCGLLWRKRPLRPHPRTTDYLLTQCA